MADDPHFFCPNHRERDLRKARDLLSADLPRNPHLGEGVLSPNEPVEIPADTLFDLLLGRINRIWAGEVDFPVSGPSSDQDDGDAA